MATTEDRRRIYIDRENGICITPQEVAQCIRDYRVDGNGNVDVGMMCSSPRINRWALNKPFRWANWGYGIDASGDAEKAAAREAVKQGLDPVEVTKILESCIGKETFTPYTKEDSLAEIAEWGYNQPRGGANEPFRIPDFDNYNRDAIAPDSGWTQKVIDADLLNEMESVDMNIADTGSYAGYNFKMIPTYNGSTYNRGLYETFSMLFGEGTDESINKKDDMEIPVSQVLSLDGYWRIALAVWIPSYGTSGGWGLFASRMTIFQYFAEALGGGDNKRELFPDFATNQSAAKLMHDHVTDNGGYAEFTAVPLFVKDIQYTYDNDGLFLLRPVSGSNAYCMMSGARNIILSCGEPPMTLYYQVINSGTSVAIKNTDTAASHTFGYYVTNFYPDTDPVQSEVRYVTLAAEETRVVAGTAAQAGYGVEVTVVSQDGVDI